MGELDKKLEAIVKKYSETFSGKIYKKESEEVDALMDAFGITQELKKENKQYWGRELGMCWQLLVTEIFASHCKDFKPAQKYGSDEPADFFLEKEAIDTKYRVGSGDSGTLKKFKQYGDFLRKEGFKPIFLFLRTDNLKAAMTASQNGGWTIYTGEDSFQYILERTGFDLKAWLLNHKEIRTYFIER
jgi:hypothetical protein